VAVVDVSAQTRQTTLTGEVVDSGDFRNRLRGFGIAVWDAGASAPDDATARHVVTVAMLALDRDTAPEEIWKTHTLAQLEDGGRP
jgi:hypothetical protein